MVKGAFDAWRGLLRYALRLLVIGQIGDWCEAFVFFIRTLFETGSLVIVNVEDGVIVEDPANYSKLYKRRFTIRYYYISYESTSY